MKSIIPTAIGSIEIEASDVKELFRQMAAVAEVFGDRHCGCCGEEGVAPLVRHVEKNKKQDEYFEMRCLNPKCRARLSFGQFQDGSGLFPVRKLSPEGQPDRASGSYGQHNGWTRWRGENKD